MAKAVCLIDSSVCPYVRAANQPRSAASRPGIRPRDLFNNGHVDYVCGSCMVVVETPDFCPGCTAREVKAEEKREAFRQFITRKKAEAEQLNAEEIE